MVEAAINTHHRDLRRISLLERAGSMGQVAPKFIKNDRNLAAGWRATLGNPMAVGSCCPRETSVFHCQGSVWVFRHQAQKRFLCGVGNCETWQGREELQAPPTPIVWARFWRQGRQCSSLPIAQCVHIWGKLMYSSLVPFLLSRWLQAGARSWYYCVSQCGDLKENGPHRVISSGTIRKCVTRECALV